MKISLSLDALLDALKILAKGYTNKIKILLMLSKKLAVRKIHHIKGKMLGVF